MFKKVLAISLAAVMIFSMIGCGNKGKEEKGTEGETAIQEAASKKDDGSREPVEIEILMTSYGTNLKSQENFVTEKILEDINVKVKLSTYANTDDTKTNLNLRLVGGTAPDIFQVTTADLADLVKQGYLLELDEYKEKMPNVQEIFDEVGAVGQIDGTQYAVVKRPQIFQDGYWIRKDWLDKLNLPVPTTLEELVATVETVMKSDPDGNGMNDTIGITGEKWNAIQPILAVYGGSRPNDLVVNKEGQVISPLYDPLYKEAIVYIKDLINKGIIDSEIMALNNQLYVDKLTQGLPVVVRDFWVTFNKPEKWGPIAEVNPEAEWVQLPDLEGPGATVADVYDPTTVGALFCVSAQLAENEEKLEAIWKLFDYVSHGDGLRLVSYGLEGEHYTIENNEIVATDKMATEADFTWLYQLTGRNEMEYLGIKFPYAKEDIDFAVSRTYLRSIKSLVIYPEWYQRADAERYMEEEVMKFIFGERPIEEYDDFIATLNSTYRYDEFVAGVNEHVQGLGVLK